MGDNYICNGAQMTCTFGMAPSALVVLPGRMVQLGEMTMANIMDFKPMVNVMPFGMCNTLSNPTVASATSAAMGVLTPMPCIPALTAPWQPGNPMMLVDNMPALTSQSMCVCTWGGVIRFTTDGQMPAIPNMTPPPIPGMPQPIQPLDELEFKSLEPWEQRQYQEDLKAAQYAGTSDLWAAESLERQAAEYEAAGDTEKAAKAREAANTYRASAQQKQNAAVEAANNKYRIYTQKSDFYQSQQPQQLSDQEVQQMLDQSLTESKEKDKQIAMVDKQIAKQDKKMAKQYQEVTKQDQAFREKYGPWEEAHAKSEDLEKRHNNLQTEANNWGEWANNAKTPEDRDYCLQQQQKYQGYADDMAKKEQQAKADEAAKMAELNKVVEPRAEAHRKYNEMSREKQALEDTRQGLEAEKKEADDTAQAAYHVQTARAKQAEHDQAMNEYNEAKADTRAKGQTARALQREEDQYREAADKNFTAASEARQWGDENGYDASKGENPFYDMHISETARYDQKAADVAVERRAADQEYAASKEVLHEKHEAVFGDEATFDYNTSQADGMKGMEKLVSKKNSQQGGNK